MIIIDPVTLGDVACVRASLKFAYDRTGTLVQVPANTLAVTYDPSDLTKAPYALVELAATNLLAWAADFSANWGKSSVTVTRNVVTAPDGTQTATLVTSGASLNTLSYGQVGASSTTMTYSIYFRRGNADMPNSRAYGIYNVSKAADVAYALVNYATGTASLTGPNAASASVVVTALPNGWFRLVLTVTSGIVVGDLLNVYAGATGGSNTSGEQWYVWGPQLEAGAKATSYVPPQQTFLARSSTGTYFDASGVLQTASANVARMTYDPNDLTRPPYLLIEGAATNLVHGSQDLSVANGWVGSPSVTAGGASYRGIPYVKVTKTTSGTTETYGYTFGTVAANDVVTLSIALRASTSSACSVGLYDNGSAAWGAAGNSTAFIAEGPGVLTQYLGGLWTVTGLSSTVDTVVCVTRTYAVATTSATAYVYAGAVGSGTIGDANLVTRVQVERSGGSVTSYIPTTTTIVTRSADSVSFNFNRAADVVGSGAGLASSNVAITETPYAVGTAYAAGAQVYDPATYAMYQSLVAGNVGNVLTDITKWTPLTSTVVNRWKMLDQYNNTQTANAEEIIIVVSPQAISQGVYLGNVDANEVRISVVDLAAGLVYRETKSLIVSTSKSSFYNWCFKPIRKHSYAVSVGLPPYANALITIAIKKPGGTPKCGMCAVGPLVDIGLSQYGLGREIKDYSTINFNFDGTSNQVPRPFAKRMDLDVIVDNTQVDFVLEALEQRRQKPVAWIGAKEIGATCIFGRYSSFKSVVESYPQSKMNLQIEGTV